MKRFSMCVAVRLAFSASIGLGAMTAYAAETTVFDAVPPTLPGNVPSLGFEATSTNEFGDKITLAPGKRSAKRVDVVLSSWACEIGSWTGSPGCVTTPGATFTHPITLNIYQADGVTLVGSVTQTFTIPFRPSADPTNCGTSPTAWFDGTSCFNGLANVVSFEGAALSAITLPDTFVYGIAYNTRSHGYSPIGVTGPYDSLNVGLSSLDTGLAPSAGTDVTGQDGVYWYTKITGWYCDGLGFSSFREDGSATCSWSPNGLILVKFVTASAPLADKYDVLDALQGLYASQPKGKTKDKLREAIDNLTKSMSDKYWVDESHLIEPGGDRVFDYENTAESKIREAIKYGLDPAAMDYVHALVAADRQLAQIALDEAVAAGGKADRIKKAQEFLAKGDAAYANQKFDEAIKNFKDAWKNAVAAW